MSNNKLSHVKVFTKFSGFMLIFLTLETMIITELYEKQRL